MLFFIGGALEGEEGGLAGADLVFNLILPFIGGAFETGVVSDEVSFAGVGMGSFFFNESLPLIGGALVTGFSADSKSAETAFFFKGSFPFSGGALGVDESLAPAGAFFFNGSFFFMAGAEDAETGLAVNFAGTTLAFLMGSGTSSTGSGNSSLTGLKRNFFC